MSLSLANDVWTVLKSSIEVGDVAGAAETLVNFLVDEDYSPNEIKQAFRGDSDIKVALEYFLESPSDGIYHEVEEDQYDYDEDDDYNESY